MTVNRLREKEETSSKTQTGEEAERACNLNFNVIDNLAPA